MSYDKYYCDGNHIDSDEFFPTFIFSWRQQIVSVGSLTVMWCWKGNSWRLRSHSLTCHTSIVYSSSHCHTCCIFTVDGRYLPTVCSCRHCHKLQHRQRTRCYSVSTLHNVTFSLKFTLIKLALILLLFFRYLECFWGSLSVEFCFFYLPYVDVYFLSFATFTEDYMPVMMIRSRDDDYYFGWLFDYNDYFLRLWCFTFCCFLVCFYRYVFKGF